MTAAADILPRTALPHEVLRAALDALDRGTRVVVATVVARHGSAPSTPGQKLALFHDCAALGTIGGGAVERVVLARMLEAQRDPEAVPRVETFRLGASLGMCCGGSVDVLIEPLSPLVHVLVVGAGHVGAFTAPLLASAGFRVTLCDAREAAADPERIAPAEGSLAPVHVLHADHDDPAVLATLPAALSHAAALVMTHDHQLDQAIIEWALARGFGFVGGVGSRAKAARTRARLEAKGMPAADVARVRMPVGADIGARSPAEIGASIAAELIAWRARDTAARAPAKAEGRRDTAEAGDTEHAGVEEGGEAMTTAQVVTVVLAAGAGKRLGGPKALLVWPGPKGEDRPLAIAHAEERLAAESRHVLVVTRKPTMLALLRFVRPGVDLLASDAADDLGPAGSLAFAVPRLGDAEIVIVTPVDTPPAKAETVAHLVDALLASPELLAVRPVSHGRAGHPVALRRATLARYADSAPPPLRDHLHALGPACGAVDVADPTVLIDLDTPADVMGNLRVLPRFFK